MGYGEREKAIFLRIKHRDTIETISYLNNFLKSKGIGKKKRNQLNMKIIDSILYRGIDSTRSILNDTNEELRKISNGRFKIVITDSGGE